MWDSLGGNSNVEIHVSRDDSKGPPLTLMIFIGIAITNEIFAGSRLRFETFSNAGMLHSFWPSCSFFSFSMPFVFFGFNSIDRR